MQSCSFYVSLNEGCLFGVPITRTIVLWGLDWGSLILGNFHFYEYPSREPAMIKQASVLGGSPQPAKLSTVNSTDTCMRHVCVCTHTCVYNMHTYIYIYIYSYTNMCTLVYT